MKLLYIFETLNKEGKIIDTYTRKCVIPERTKIYKDILNMLNDNSNPTESIKYYIELPF